MKELIKHYEILKKPLVTEKTLDMYQKENKVVIEVSLKSNKLEVKRAFEAAFPGTTVEYVNMIVSNSRTRRRGRFIQKIGKKKKAIIKLSPDSSVDIYGIDFE